MLKAKSLNHFNVCFQNQILALVMIIKNGN